MSQENILPYIRTIKIDGLFGHITLSWDLHPGVNVLSGVNGSGKSSILQALGRLLKTGYYESNKLKPITGIEVLFTNGDKLPKTNIDQQSNIENTNVDTISTFDTSIKNYETLQKLTGNNIYSDLDWELYLVNSKYIKQQLRLGKMAIDAILNGKDTTNITEITKRNTLFFDILDSFFNESNKRVVREKDEIFLTLNDHILSPYQLSSGEKQLIVILYTVFCQESKPYIMLMDEPEISLHFEWQKKLIDAIMKLNPNLQLIITTHSPAVVMEGWIDKVTDINDIIIK